MNENDIYKLKYYKYKNKYIELKNRYNQEGGVSGEYAFFFNKAIFKKEKKDVLELSYAQLCKLPGIRAVIKIGDSIDKATFVSPPKLQPNCFTRAGIVTLSQTNIQLFFENVNRCLTTNLADYCLVFDIQQLRKKNIFLLEVIKIDKEPLIQSLTYTHTELEKKAKELEKKAEEAETVVNTAIIRYGNKLIEADALLIEIEKLADAALAIATQASELIKIAATISITKTQPNEKIIEVITNAKLDLSKFNAVASNESTKVTKLEKELKHMGFNLVGHKILEKFKNTKEIARIAATEYTEFSKTISSNPLVQRALTSVSPIKRLQS